MSIRQHARQTVMQALYQWHFSHTDVNELLLSHLANKKPSSIDIDFFRHVLTGALEHIEILDKTIVLAAKRDLEEISPIELAILRLGTYEILYRPDIPLKVSISEATDLAHRFGPQESYRFVNGVLDKIPSAKKTAI